MSRPETHADLPQYERGGHQVATVTADYVVKYPSLGHHLLAALAEAERLGMSIEDGVISIPKTTDELDAALAQRQRMWDNSAERYAKAAADPESVPESYWRGDVDRFAAAEGLEPINWGTSEQVAR